MADSTHLNPFIALLTSLPAGNSTLRMRVWRALKSAGSGVLRDGVYVLPADAAQAGALAELESAVRAAGGFAMTAQLNFAANAQIEHVRRLFDRSADYGALVKRMVTAKGSLQRLGTRKAGTLVERLRRSFDELAATDFYPGQAKLQAEEALAGLERQTQDLQDGGEPRSAAGRVRRLDAGKYTNRVWATRKNPWVDRLASAWLIRRFIDRKAKFAWIERPRDRPRNAVGFDFDGAEFTHVGNRVTFEVLLSSFGLDDDVALERIAAIVHFLDVGGIPVEDAKGLALILKGARDGARGDDELTTSASGMFDCVYAAYRNETAS